MEMRVTIPCKTSPLAAMQAIQEELVPQLESGGIVPDWEEIAEIGDQVKYLLEADNGNDSSARISITIKLKFKKWSLEIVVEF